MIKIKMAWEILKTSLQHKTMIVVGIFHLPGLKQELIKNGYELKPVY